MKRAQNLKNQVTSNNPSPSKSLPPDLKEADSGEQPPTINSRTPTGIPPRRWGQFSQRWITHSRPLTRDITHGLIHWTILHIIKTHGRRTRTIDLVKRGGWMVRFMMGDLFLVLLLWECRFLCRWIWIIESVDLFRVWFCVFWVLGPCGWDDVI